MDNGTEPVQTWFGLNLFGVAEFEKIGSKTVSFTLSERAFSSCGTTRTAKHNRHKPEAFEALQLLKSAYCNRYLVADKEAHKLYLSITDLDLTESDDDAPKWKGKGHVVLDNMVSTKY